MTDDRRVWRGYFDESGNLKSDQVFVVSGFLIHPWENEKLEREWAALLEPHGLDCFHMVEFVHSRGRFSEMPQPDKLELIKDLISLIIERTQCSITIAFNPKRWPIKIDPYEYAVVSVIEHMAMTIAAIYPGYEKSADLACFFEAGHSSYAASTRSYVDRKRFGNPGQMLNPPSLEKILKDSAACLQAADILAWLSAKHIKEMLAKSGRPMRRDFARLVEHEFLFRLMNSDDNAFNTFDDWHLDQPNDVRDRYIVAMFSEGATSDAEMAKVHAYFDARGALNPLPKQDKG